MRRLFTGIVLFLIWSSLSTWYYANNIFPVNKPEQETVLPETTAVDTVAESPPEMPVLPDLPKDITLYFEFDKSAILPSSSLASFLTGSMSYLAADENACLHLTGYTCSIGNDTYNMELGLRRAKAVQKYFLEKGYSSECIKLVSKGESNPAADNSTNEGRIKNRRVTVQIKTQ
jgi:OOP family OmpA-OmpF porin